MMKNKFFIAGLLLSNSCLASFPFINDLNDLPSTQLIPFSQNTIHSESNEFANLVKDFFIERAAINNPSDNTNKSVQLVNSDYQINPGNLQAKDWKYFTDLVKQSTLYTTEVDPSTPQKINSIAEDYWDLFQNLRIHLNRKDIKYFDTTTFKGKNNFNSVLLNLTQFTNLYEAFLEETRKEAMVDIGKFTKYEDLQKCDAIVRATWKIFVDAYHKFNGSTDDIVGPFLGLNNIYIKFNTDCEQKFLYYMRYDDHIRPFLVYSHTPLPQDVYETYVSYADFKDSNKPRSMALFKFNEAGIPKFYDEAGVAIQRTNYGYTICIYYGEQGEGAYPYAKSKTLSCVAPTISTKRSATMNHDEARKIEIEAAKITRELFKNNDQDITNINSTSESSSTNVHTLKDRIHAAAKSYDVSEKAEELIQSEFDAGIGRSVEMLETDSDIKQMLHTFALKILDDKDFAFLKLPNNRYEIQIQQKESELDELLQLQEQYMQSVQDYNTALKHYSIAHTSLEPDITTPASSDHNFDSCNVVAEIEAEIKNLEDDLQALYKEKIAFEQATIRARVASDADRPSSTLKKTGKNPSKVNKKNNQNSKKSKNSVGASTTISDNQKQELEILESTKMQLIKMSKDLEKNTYQSTSNRKFNRFISLLLKIANLDGDNLIGQLNKSSHGLLEYSSNTTPGSSTTTQKISIVRSHGLSKDNTVSPIQVKNTKEILKEKIRIKMKVTNQKIDHLKNEWIKASLVEKI